MILTEHTVKAAEHAAANGLIITAEIPAIVQDKKKTWAKRPVRLNPAYCKFLQEILFINYADVFFIVGESAGFSPAKFYCKHSPVVKITPTLAEPTDGSGGTRRCIHFSVNF
ncbi:MAG: hypothetical protein IPL50_09560 [Chitinophagaceae bacterium]|nr:hypothetical protein [Chitinophagaceae bacterium]